MIESLVLSGFSGNTLLFSYDLMSNTSFVKLEKDSWNDGVAVENTSLIGTSMYNPVEVSFMVSIEGLDESDAWSKYNAFVSDVQQIAKIPVVDGDIYRFTIAVQVFNSSPVYSAKILGNIDMNPNTLVVTPPNTIIRSVDGMNRIDHVNVRFLRDQYVGDTTTLVNAVFSRYDITTNDGAEYFVPSLTFPSVVDTYSPVNIRIDLSANQIVTGIIPQTHCIFSQVENDRNAIKIMLARDISAPNPTGFSVVPVGTNVNTITSMYEQSSLIQWQAQNNNQTTKTIALLAKIFKKTLLLGVMRSEIANTEAVITPIITNSSGDNSYRFESKAVIGNPSLNPVVINFGILVNEDEGSTFSIICQNVSTALSRITFDAFIAIDVDNLLSYMIVGGIKNHNTDITRHTIDDQRITSQMITNIATPKSKPQYIYGFRQVYRKKRKIQCLFLSPLGTAWNAFSFKTQNTLSATSQTGALVPRGDS